jgi:iron complex outermembrane receptor protein
MKMLFALFASFWCCAAVAQNSLTGKVTDFHDHTPVVGATVYIPDLKKGTSTNADGGYTIDHLPKGRFLVEFKFIGYATLIQAVQLNGAVQLDIALNSAVTELNEVVVTGISHSSELKNNPLPISTLNTKSLTENTATNLIDNISKKAGVNQLTTGPAISKPIIRGLGYNRIISLYDGIRQEGQQWGDEHGIEIDEYSVDRVEIIKGAGSLMYGSDGLGGVLNFLTPNPVAEGTVIGKWLSNYQTNNGLTGNSLMNAGNLKGLYWLARASLKDSKPYSNAYDGKVFNSGFRERDVNGHIGLSKSWGYTQLNVSSFHQFVGLVGGDRDSTGHFTRLKNVNGSAIETAASNEELNSYHLFIPRQQISHARISNTTNVYLGPSRLQLNVGYQRNQRKEFGEVLNEQTKNLYFDLRTLNYNLTYFLPEGKGWQVSLGTSGMTQQSQNKGIEFLIPAYQSFDWGVFGFAKRHFTKLDVAGGIRFDRRSIAIDALYLDDQGAPTSDTNATQKFKSGNLTFSNYSASAGLTYPISNVLSMKFNASRGFRAPNIAELASNGRHEGSLRYEYGNFNLKPETSLQLDAGIVFNSTHVSAEFSVFQNDIRHYIFTEKLAAKNGLDSIPDPSQPVPAYQYVQGQAQLRGGEFFIDLHPHPLDWLHFENGFSFVDALNKSQSRNDSTKYLPYIPAPRYQSELRGNFKKIGSRLVNLFLKVEFSHIWPQNRVLLENRTETTTPSYSLWNAGLGTDIITPKGITLFSFYFTVNNIFDVAYQNHLSRLKYGAVNPMTGRVGVFNMGRNFSFKILIPITLVQRK